MIPPTLSETLALLGLAAFGLGALVLWLIVTIWLRPLWESRAWWRSAPASVRDRITAQRAAAEQFEAERASTLSSRPDDVTAIMEGLPRIPAHDPPSPEER